ncbi:MAG: ABC transporter permease, partial [Terriglobia bacterium]
ATLVKEVTREMWGWIWLETLLQDLGYGLRQLRRNPGFAAIIIATLAIGIGANTAVFSVVYSVLLKPLPYPHADQLVNLFESNPQKKVASAALTYPDFQEFVRHSGIFSGLAGYQAHDLVLSGLGEPAEVHTMSVTPGIFSVLGIKPMAGRGFIAQDGKRGAAPVVVLSESIWRSRFGANPNIIGQSVDLDKRSFRVVGIMPANFHFSLRASSEDVWIPMVQDPLWSRAMTQPGERFLRVIGRLKGGVSMRQSEAAMNTVSARLRGTFPVQDSGWSVHLEREQSDVVGAAGSALWILFGAVGLILLIACANIANLLLARATSRAREIAVRVALGAGRTRVVRQLLTESTLLGLLGGVAGIVVAYWGVQGLRSVLPSSLPRAQDVGVDGWVLVFAFVLSAAATVIFGLAPALFAADSNLQTSLKEGSGRVDEGGGRRRLRSLLASAEIALAMILLAGAGLLIRSFTRLTAVDPGFNPEHLVTAEISLPQYQYSKPAQWTAFTREL